MVLPRHFAQGWRLRGSAATVHQNLHLLRLISSNQTPFGDIITDPELVEQTIRRAQLALLNPSVDCKKFETYDIPAEAEKRPLGSAQELAFSNDVVCLNIEGSDVTDLTVIDLPGIISSVGKHEDPANITLVENMIKSYIKKECLILLTTTMRGEWLALVFA